MKSNPYWILIKPRMIFMVLVVAALGFYLGSSEWNHVAFAVTMIGCALSSAGAFILNQYLEQEEDSQMERTCKRPLPTKQISPTTALLLGVFCSLAGVFSIFWWANLKAAFLVLLTVFLYVLVYTPMKQLTWWNTPVGAIPGAIPPMVGWAAASNTISWEAWALFAILFVWQHPHFYAIAWMYRDDYERGGFKMLPVVQPSGKSTVQQIIFFSLLMIPTSLLPTFLNMTGVLYALGAALTGLWMLKISWELKQVLSFEKAKRLLYATLIYLPAISVAALLDSILL